MSGSFRKAGGTGTGLLKATLSVKPPKIGVPVRAKLPGNKTGTLQFTRTLLVAPFTKTNIAGAVASAVNFLDYTPVAGDSAYNIGVDATTTASSAAGAAYTPSLATVPGAMSAPVLTAGVSSVVVVFTAPADGGSAILDYDYLDNNGAHTTLTGSGQSAAEASGTATTGQIRARNSVGFGPYSPQSNSVVPSAPSVAIPTIASDVAIVGTPTQGSPLNITAAVFSGTVDSTAREVWRVNSDASLTQVFAGTTAQSYTVLAADVSATGLYVRDTASNSGGSVTSRSATKAAVVTPVAPGAPTVVATKGPGLVNLVITPGTAGSAATAGYTVALPNGAADSDNGTTKLTRTITGVVPFTAQTFSVVANSSGGDSVAGVSNSVAADRVDTTPPALVAGTITGNTVRLTYTKELTGSAIAPSQFSVAINGGAAVAPSALSQLGSLVVLTVPSTAAIGDTAAVSYTQGAAASAVRDTSNNLAVNLANRSIANNATTATTNVYGSTKWRANEAYATGASGLKTSHLKIEAEDAFVAFRVGYIEHNTAGTMPTLEFLYGVSDVGTFDTAAHQCYPTSGGVSKNTMAANSGEVAWRRGTWGGGSNGMTPVPASSFYESKVNWSDWMPQVSIPRTDVAGARPMLVLRIANTNAAGVFTQAVVSTYAQGRGQPFHRETFTSVTLNDAVNNLANVPAVNAVTGNELSCFVEFQYASGLRTVIVTGDSRKSAKFNAYLNSWEIVALRQLVGTTGKVGVVNLAGSGHSQVQFLKMVNDFLDSGGHATDIIIPSYSQNGFVNAATYATNMQPTLDRCTAAGMAIWMDTDYALGGTSVDTERAACNNAARALFAQGKIKGLIDTDSMISDYGTQYPSLKAGVSTGGDAIHIGPTAQTNLLQPMLMKVWQDGSAASSGAASSNTLGSSPVGSSTV